MSGVRNRVSQGSPTIQIRSFGRTVALAAAAEVEAIAERAARDREADHAVRRDLVVDAGRKAAGARSQPAVIGPNPPPNALGASATYELKPKR
jgi:hypothetical protein